MKIGIFAYNFEHWKTQQGIINLCMAGYKPSIIFAADPVELSFYKSKIRVSLKDQFLWHPSKIAEHYGIDYKVIVHNSQETANAIKDYDLDIGIILGSRILKPIAFEDAKIDRGLLIEKETISVYEDDTLVDLHVRIQNLEQKIMISSIKKLENEGKENLLVLPEGNYYKSVTPDLEEILMQKFESYKKEK
mgnify:CR=1 FL=1